MNLSNKPIRLGISSCPNDTFIFYALINGKISTNHYINEIIADISQLNEMLLNSQIDVGKGSIAIYPRIKDKYVLLPYGLAMGKGCGPIIIGKGSQQKSNIESSKIAIPGKNTTACLLLKKYKPNISDDNLIEMNFAKISYSVLENKTDFGVIIHETRFTYSKLGLQCVVDLGDWWEKQYELPLPLGGIYVKRDLGNDFICKIVNSIRESIFFSLNNPNSPLDFVKKYARELEDDVIKSHINLYVNNYSIDPQNDGKMAIIKLLSIPDEEIFFNN